MQSSPRAAGGFKDGGQGGGFREEDHPRDGKGEFKGSGRGKDGGQGGGPQVASPPAGTPPAPKPGKPEAPRKSLSRPGYRDITHDPEERARLGVPKGFTDVHAAEDPQADVVWVARNEAGESDSRRSSEYTERQKAQKFARQQEFGKVKPLLDAQTDRDFRAGREEAAVLRLISLSGFRNGGEKSESQVKGAPKGVRSKTYGANTLEKSHVRVEGHTVHFDFIGKSGVRQQHSIANPELAGDIRRRLEERPGARLFSSSDAKVLKYMRSLEGAGRPDDPDPFRIHDYRTFVANAAARMAMEQMEPPTSPEEYWRQYDAVGAVAGRRIGDEPATALEHYVDPLIFDLWRTRAGVAKDAQRPKTPKPVKAGKG